MRAADGTRIALDVEAWHRPASEGECRVLARLQGPVLDVGCGPGRHVRALAERGVTALGVDSSPAAVRVATASGTPVLHRSVFDHLPGRGRWRAAVLFDGNIGIGGDPLALLRRLHELLAPGGEVVAEVGAPGSGSRRRAVRVETDAGAGPWFPWSEVAADDVRGIGAEAGFATDEVWEIDDRWWVSWRRV